MQSMEMVYIRPPWGQQVSKGQGNILLTANISICFAADTKQLANNNWPGAGRQAIAARKMDKVVKVKLTEEGNSKMKTFNEGGRSISLHPGTDALNLKDRKIVESATVHGRHQNHFNDLASLASVVDPANPGSLLYYSAAAEPKTVFEAEIK